MDENIRIKARQLLDDGELKDLENLLVPYVNKGIPFALHLRACFSLADSLETEEEYSKRYIQQMTRASEGGIAKASYQMGANHLYGDDVQQDYKLATMYFERAISQGHSYTKFTYGFSIYYGNDENPKDEAKGLALLQEAVNEGVEKAIKELELINVSL